MKKIIKFDHFEVNLNTRELYFHGEKVTIQKKSFELLLYLIEFKEKAVSRNELIEKLWNGRAVSDSVLSHASTKLRTALNDNNGKGKYIRTVHGFGLQFVGNIASSNQQKTPVNTNDKSNNTIKYVTFLAFLIVSTLIYVVFKKTTNISKPTENIAHKIEHTKEPKISFINANLNTTKKKWQQQGLMVYLNQVLHYSNQSMILPYTSNTEKFYAVDNIVKMNQSDGQLSFTYFNNNNPVSDLTVNIENLQVSIKNIQNWVCDNIVIETQNCQTKLLPLTTDSAYVIESYIRGRASLIDGSFEEAKSYLQVSIEQDANFLLARLAISEAFYGLSNYQKAISHAQVVIETSKNKSLIIDAYKTIGKSFFRLAELDKALDAFNSILNSEEATEVQIATAYYEMAKIFNSQGNPQKAYELANKSQQISVKLNLPINTARALSIMGDIKLTQGNLVLAEKHLLESLRIFEDLNYDLGIEYILSPLGIVMESQRKYQASLAFANQRKEIAEKLGDPISIAGTHLHLANLLIKMGEVSDAEIHAQKMWEIVIGIDEPQALLAAYYIAAEVANAQFNFQLALDKLSLALNISQKSGMKENEVDLLCAIAKTAIDAKQYTLAEQTLQDCQALAKKTNNQLFEATSQLYFAQLLLAQKFTDGVANHLEHSLKILEKQPNDELHFHIHMTFFDLFINQNNQKAQQYLNLITKEYQSDYQFIMAQARILFINGKKTKALQLMLEAKHEAKSHWSNKDEEILNQMKMQLSQTQQ
ncbi:MAG: tetratricopeptide repeat protein [Marinicellaceae bacterium]